MTIEADVDVYLRHVTIERGLSLNTVSAYRRDLAAYTAWLSAVGVTHLSDVTPATISDYLQHVVTRDTKPLAATSQTRMLAAVRGLHRFLLEEGRVPWDVTANVRPPKLPARLPKAISIDQVTALLNACAGDDIAQLRDRALLETMYATGARVSEAIGLNVDDVIDADVVRLTGKGSKQRIVPLGSYARSAVSAYLVRARPVLSLRGRSTPALFLGVRGARLSRQNVWLIIRAAAERAQLSVDVSPHTLRHSFATHLLAGGADVRVVQELLGHASVATTQIYTLVTPDALREVYLSAHPRAR